VIPFWATTLVAFGWGAVWGSFGNVVLYRWPREMSLARPGSRCPACGHPIRWYDNVPIVSQLILGSRCRDCGAPFSIRYAVVEAASALIAVAVWYRLASAAIDEFGAVDPTTLGRFLVEFQVLWGLAIISAVDLETLLVPDVIVLPLIVLALAGQFVLEGGHPWHHLAAAVFGYLLVFLLFSFGWRKLTGREGMGLGDGKILALLGAHLGPQSIPFVLVAAAVQGLIYVLAVTLAGGRLTPEGADEPPAPSLRETKVPFGPFLALAAIEAVFWAPAIAPRVADLPILSVLFGAW